MTRKTQSQMSSMEVVPSFCGGVLVNLAVTGLMDSLKYQAILKKRCDASVTAVSR